MFQISINSINSERKQRYEKNAKKAAPSSCEQKGSSLFVFHKARPIFFFRCALALILSLLPCFSLLADRLYLKDGTILRGRILNIGAGSYRFQKDGAKKVQTVPKRSVLRVTFSQGKPERGYDGFFARFWTGMGTGEYKVTLQGFGSKSEKNANGSKHRLI